jgi:hypothetical protein
MWDGTYLFLWQANQVFAGDPSAMIAQAQDLGITGVLIKFANGSLNGDRISQAYMDQFINLVQPFKSAGLKVGGWIYQYLTDVQGEVDACFQAIEAGADWIVLDGEVELQGKTQEVEQFGQLFRERYPTFPLGLSSFAIASYHPEVPFNAYNGFVDVMMPQIYWAEIGWDVSVAYHSSIASYQPFNKPISPTGQSNGAATPETMAQFVQLVRSSNLTGVSWWDWQGASESQLQAIEENIIMPPSTIANDVREGDAFSHAIQYVINKDIMHIDVQGNFNPNQTVTRGMLAQVIFNIDHLPSHSPSPALTSPASSKIANDVGMNDPYSQAIQYVMNQDIMHVDALGNFNPNQAVSRGMLAQVIFNIDHLSNSSSTATLEQNTASSVISNDVKENDPFSPAIQYVMQQDLMHVDENGNFKPNQTVTRGMLSQVIYNRDHLKG